MLPHLSSLPWSKIFTVTGLTMIISSVLIYTCSLSGICSSPPGQTFLSPLVDYFPILGSQTTSSPPIVLGFLPYWNLKYEPHLHYQLLTHLAYFSLNVTSTGDLVTQEPGWNAFNSDKFTRTFRRARGQGTKIILVVTAMDQSTIETIITRPIAQNRLASHLKSLIAEKNLDGLNLDFEYAGNPTLTQQHQFTDFVTTLTNQLKLQFPQIEISLDVFADSALKPRIWDVNKLAQVIDYFVVMAYDFHRPSSPVAGPIAPLRGGGESWELDVTQSLTSFLTIVPPSKLVLGVPYYGYGWHTTSATPLATTYPDSGELATFNRIQNLIRHPDNSITNLSINWNAVAFSPYLTYQQSGRWYQIWFEDERSLKLKYDLVKQTGLAGVALWALGYDGDHPQLWHLLKSSLLR